MLEQIRAFLKATAPNRLSRADSFWLRMDEFAAGLEPALESAIHAAIELLRGSLTEDQLRAMLENNDIGGIMRAIDEALAAATPVVRDALRDAVTRSGNWALENTIRPFLPAAVAPTFSVRFDMLNPLVTTFLRGYELPLIRQLSDDARATIHQLITDGLRRGAAPAATARAIRPALGLTARQAQSLVLYEAELRSGSRGALGRALRDARYDRSVTAAVSGKSPLSEEKIAAMVERLRARTLAHRAETVARTESMRALNAGSHMAWQQSEQEGFVSTLDLQREWIIGRDERTCPICHQVPSLNPHPIAFRDLFVTPNGPTLYPPLHPRCRCTVFTSIRIRRAA